MKKRLDGALAQLQAVNEKAIREAGPRYTPGVDPNAPNIEIGYLEDALQALSLSDGWRDRASELAAGLRQACEYQPHRLGHLFGGGAASLSRVAGRLEEWRVLSEPSEIRRAAGHLRRNAHHAAARLQSESDGLWERFRALPDEP